MSENPNIILIVFDTLRSDILSLYGGDAVSPNINSFANDSNLFNNTIAPSPWTVPSHISLFTGLYPGEHKVHEDIENGDGKALEKISGYNGPTIIEKLSRKGYNNLGFSTNPWLSPYTGFDRYFNSFTFFNSEYETQEEMFAVSDYKKFGRNRIEAAKNLLFHGKIEEFKNYYNIHKRILRRKKEKNYPYMKGSDLIVDHIMNSSFEEPFFIFINFMEVHEPVAEWELDIDDRKIKYLDISGKEPIPERHMEETRNGYKKSLSMLDRQFGRLMDHFKKLKIYDKSLIIVTSDHGQAMKENYKYPYYGHGNFLYNEIIEVPLLIKLPGNIKIKEKNGYQSLIGIPRFIENVIDGNFEDTITEEMAYSESFGPVHDLQGLVKNGILPNDIDYKSMIEKMFYPKKAIYKKGYKLVVNGLNGTIDEFTYNKKSLSPDENKNIINELKEDIYIFKGTEKFVV